MDFDRKCGAYRSDRTFWRTNWADGSNWCNWCYRPYGLDRADRMDWASSYRSNGADGCNRCCIYSYGPNRLDGTYRINWPNRLDWPNRRYRRSINSYWADRLDRPYRRNRQHRPDGVDRTSSYWTHWPDRANWGARQPLRYDKRDISDNCYWHTVFHRRNWAGLYCWAAGADRV